MPDDLKKVGPRDQKRVSKQKHEVAYQKKKKAGKKTTKKTTKNKK